MNNSTSQNLVVVVTQEEYGIISTQYDNCPHKIATFGCGPCIGILCVKSSVAGLLHVSSESFITGNLITGIRSNFKSGLCNMLCKIRTLTEQVNNEPMYIYLIGGQNNESTKTVILKQIFSVDFADLTPIIKSDKACSNPHVSSIMFDFDNNDEKITTYNPTGLELLNLDINKILGNLYEGNLSCCHDPRYANQSSIFDLNKRILPNFDLTLNSFLPAPTRAFVFIDKNQDDPFNQYMIKYYKLENIKMNIKMNIKNVKIQQKFDIFFTLTEEILEGHNNIKKTKRNQYVKMQHNTKILFVTNKIRKSNKYHTINQPVRQHK